MQVLYTINLSSYSCKAPQTTTYRYCLEVHHAMGLW